MKVTQEKLVKAISEVKRIEQIKIKELMFLNRSRVYQKSFVFRIIMRLLPKEN